MLLYRCKIIFGVQIFLFAEIFPTRNHFDFPSLPIINLRLFGRFPVEKKIRPPKQLWRLRHWHNIDKIIISCTFPFTAKKKYIGAEKFGYFIKILYQNKVLPLIYLKRNFCKIIGIIIKISWNKNEFKNGNWPIFDLHKPSHFRNFAERESHLLKAFLRLFRWSELNFKTHYEFKFSFGRYHSAHRW